MRTTICAILILWAAPGFALTDPATLNPAEDTYLSADHTGKPGGRGERNEFQIYGVANEKQFRALLRFDLGEVKAPPAAAILRVHAWNVGRPQKTELIRCHAVVRAWDEKNASWDQCLADDQWTRPGADWDPIAVAGCNVTAQMGGESGYWLDFDVTALVQEWVLKRRPNYGLLLMFDPECTAEVRCRSKEATANPPELKLAWATQLTRGGGMVPGHKIKPYGQPVKLEPIWGTTALNMARLGEAFTQKMLVRGGAKPYTFSATGLPEGVALSADGVLSGKVDKEGRFPISITCAGADGKRATQRLELVVQKPADVAAGKKDEEKKPAAGAGSKKPGADEE